MTVCNNSGAITNKAADVHALLWAKMKKGNEQALTQLYGSYFQVLRKHGVHFCKNRELVDDSIHELFSRLWIRREQLGMAENVKLYLCKSLERIIIAQVSRERRHVSYSSAEPASLDSFEQLMIDSELRKERIDEIKKCLLSLPKCQREVILLKFFNDLTYTEISEIMNVQLPSVYNLISKAIEQLRQKMQFSAVAQS